MSDRGTLGFELPNYPTTMGNIESGRESIRGSIESLDSRLNSLEETIKSVEAAHRDAQGHHFPALDAADTYIYGARLLCRPEVRVLLGPVVGEVTVNSAVILLEVDIAPGLGSEVSVSCHVSLAGDTCPRGRVVTSVCLRLPCRRPRAFRIGCGESDDLRPGRTYTACFGGVCREDARTRVARFRTPDAALQSPLRIVALSGDRPDRLEPGEPSLWRVLRERIEAPRCAGLEDHVDVVVHAGGQAWMGDAFDEAWELLRHRAREPLLSDERGWKDAQREATERLREAVRRAWNLPDKRAMLSSVSNLMLCGEGDVHPCYGGEIARLSSAARRKAFGDENLAAELDESNRQSKQDARALDAVVRACRRVFCEYQTQLLWKATACSRRSRKGHERNLWAEFDAEEDGVERALAEARLADRDTLIKERKVAIAEEALRRAETAGNFHSDVGTRAAEDRVLGFKRELEAARALKMAMTRRKPPAAASSVANRASQAAILSVTDAIGFVLLDTLWSRAEWDGGVSNREASKARGTGEDESWLLSSEAWESLTVALERDSELRLLVVVLRFALVGGSEARDESGSSEGSAPESLRDEPGKGALEGRVRLLDRLFAWKTREVWREVVLVCGAGEAGGGRGGLRSACELEITDSEHPGVMIRQMIAGPITDDPGTVFPKRSRGNDSAVSGSMGCGRFRFHLVPSEDSGNSAGSGGRDKNRSSSGEVRVDLDSESASPAIYALQTAILHVKEKEPQKLRGSSPGVLETCSAFSSGLPNFEVASGKRRHTSDAIGSEGSGRLNAVSSIVPSVGEGDMNEAGARIRRHRVSSVAADGQCSYLEVTLNGGLSPAAAFAAGLDPDASSRGRPASVAAEAVTASFAGATVVLGPVVGRVTQGSAVILAEVGSKAPVACVLTDGVSGVQHRKMCMLHRGRPHAFFFDGLEESRHYTVALDGVDNAETRTGAFTTLKAWPDRREAPAWRALKRASATNSSSATSGLVGDVKADRSDPQDEGSPFDLRLLFVSGTGLAAGASQSGKLCGDARGGSVAGDMCGALARELWGPCPEADVVVHTGSQVDLKGAILEALPVLSAAEEEEEGSEAREEAEDMVMERIREAYRFQWSLAGPRAFLSRGSHLMLRGEADLALPHRAHEDALSRGAATAEVDQHHAVGDTAQATGVRGEGAVKDRLLGLQLSAYARATLARLVSRAFRDYQRQLWDPLSAPLGLDMSDAGYARGGAGIDSSRETERRYSGDYGGPMELKAAKRSGEWHFHTFGETVGLFALDVRERYADLQHGDERAPLLSGEQWTSLERALSLEEIQVMILAGDAPFVSDSIQDARTKGRYSWQQGHQSRNNVQLRRSWIHHGAELLRLVSVLVKWKSAGAVNGEPREVVLVGGGMRYPLETVIYDSTTSTDLTQVLCGPFYGAPRSEIADFEISGPLNGSVTYHHVSLRGRRDTGSRSGDGDIINHEMMRRKEPMTTSGNAWDDRDDRGDLGHNNKKHIPGVWGGELGRSDGDDNDEATSLFRYPSCVLVRCNAQGAGCDAHLCVRSRMFSPMTWAMWCEGRNVPPLQSLTLSFVPSASESPPEPLGFSKRRTRSAPLTDFGSPRRVSRGANSPRSGWEGCRHVGGDNIGAAAKRGEDDWLLSISAVMQGQAVATVLRRAFASVLDVGDDRTGAAGLVARSLTEMTRRVFTCVTSIYDDVRPSGGS